MRTHTLCALAATAALLALAACGGSSSGTGNAGGGPNGGTENGGEMTAAQLATAADTALTAAKTAVDMVMDDSDETKVTDADAKVTAAEAAVEAASGADNHAALSERLGTLKGTLTTKKASRTAAMRMKAAAEQQAMAATGKALFAALGGPAPASDSAAVVKNALDNLADASDVQTSLSNSGEPTGIKVDPADGGGDLPVSVTVNDVDVPNESPVVFTTVTHVKTVGDWMVSDQTDGVRTEGQLVPEFTDRARVYNDRGQNTKKDAATHFGSSDKPTAAGTYTAAKRELALNFAVDPHIASPDFPVQGAGSKTFEPKDGASEVKVRGTYQGAPGYYYCKEDCQVQVRRGGLSLYAGWRFVHDPDAQVSLPDSEYLYFGWWVRSNSSDDVPRLATAFFGFEGVNLEESKTTSARDYNGSATFEGPAVGQYAIHDPLNGKGEGGAFEAKATLKARFGNPNNVRDAGLSGVIDEFRLNGGSEDPGWSVELVKSNFETAGKKVTKRGTKTVMSIGDVKGPEVLNSWEARLFDTTPGIVADGGDGDNEADKVLGTFYSEYNNTHRLVGAFGASNITKQNVNE